MVLYRVDGARPFRFQAVGFGVIDLDVEYASEQPKP